MHNDTEDKRHGQIRAGAGWSRQDRTVGWRQRLRNPNRLKPQNAQVAAYGWLVIGTAFLFGISHAEFVVGGRCLAVQKGGEKEMSFLPSLLALRVYLTY
jgi:hypothetical protein